MHNKKAPSFLFFTPAIGWGILICYFSLMPSTKIPSALVSVRDFILHFLIYAALGVLAYFGANQFSTNKLSSKEVFILVAACFLLGLILEILQELFAQGRHFELSDITFNTLGILLSLLLHKKMAAIKV